MFKYEYTENDFRELNGYLMRSNMISHGSPDQYQYHQNELSKAIARFLLKPYFEHADTDEKPS